MLRAFVTGATGFLGLNLVKQLKREGWHVIATHRAGSNIKPLQYLDVELREADIVHADALFHAMLTGVDAVFHVAASTSQWRLKNREQARTNIEGTRNVVRAALATGARRFIHTSSDAVYGDAAFQGTINEETPSNAQDHWLNYVRTKWQAEQEVRAGILEGLDAVILQPTNVLGPFDYHGFSTLLRLVAEERTPGVPPGQSSWCDVREIARAHVAAFERGVSGESYLLGGVTATYEEVTRIFAELCGVKPPRQIPAFVVKLLGRVSEWGSYITRQEPDVTPEKAFLVCAFGRTDDAKARRDLGYRHTTLQTILEETYRWMKQDGLIRDRSSIQ